MEPLKLTESSKPSRKGKVMEPKDYATLRDFQGVEFQFFSATYQRGSEKNMYHVFISGVNENGFHTVSTNFFSMEKSPLKSLLNALHQIGFKVRDADSVREIKKYLAKNNLDGMVIVVKPD